MRSQKGFSLIELLIVVAIILIIATISIPYLLRAKQSANESAAIANVRTINSGEATYNTLYPNLGFADLKPLGGQLCCFYHAARGEPGSEGFLLDRRSGDPVTEPTRRA